MEEKNTIEWACSLPKVGERQLTSEEIGKLRQMARNSRNNIWLLWIVYIFAWFLVFQFSFGSSSPNGLTQDTLVMASIALIFVGLPAAILFTRDWMNERRANLDDIKSQNVKLFAGLLNAQALSDPIIRNLYERRNYSCELDKPIRIEILASSKRVLTINGHEIFHGITVNIVELPKTPDLLETILWPLNEPAISNAEPLDQGKRRMKEAELEELSKYIRNSWTKPLPWSVGLTIWLSVPLTFLIIDHGAPASFNWPLFTFLAVITLLRDISLVNGIRRAIKLNRDRKTGVVVILRVHPQNSVAKIDTAILSEGSLQQSEKWAEILPVSGFVWSESGEPAAWRKRGVV
jgi:hypothetical protein